ncbi:hypothetical protein BX616_003739 [Lobosporangium transversale]|uniref:DUF3533 domain-containing protein n=1 Tax=Lobosporangium transversale TaxID=64571 RepID=A0A1Y2GFQ1_9FUNG|nr:hypothetical protein BCR41DRAFT_424219 [Lobosporangium transversale]KAF9898670.1 hypothetical protein BX616_003739 [Lobosporangium transversale]ORZ09440.1 hypothetical protein BCR41DRAFT_424219 [Lobosporangium transversale]|eukprot:XP_021878893.1 hypothetical protein BCR41DRAFT_424219 [Lobosporangium transversale]
MPEHDESTSPQQYRMTNLEKETEDNGAHSLASSTAPVHQSKTRDSTSIPSDSSSDTSSEQNYHSSIPQFFVLPHLLKKSAWLLLVATSAVILVYIWLYLGSLWSPLSRVKNVEIILYNADTGFDYSQTPPQLIPLFQSITQNQSLGNIVHGQIMNPEGQLSQMVSWIDKSKETGWDRESLIKQVEDGEVWGLLYIPANFSNNLLSYAPSTSTGPATAATLKMVDMEYVFDQGRNYGTHSIIEKYISKSMDLLSKTFERQLLTSPANQTLLQTMHPIFWTQSIHMTETIMSPVLVYGQNFATYIVFIVLYIGSILAVFSICKYLPNTIETVGVLTFGSNEAGKNAIRTSSQIPKFPALRIVMARHTVAMLFSLVHTILIWMVPQVLHGHQMSEHFNAGIAFAFIWFVGMSFISILFFLSHLLTVDGFQAPATMLLILMLTSSSGILDWVVMPGFFRIGIVFPFTYAIRGLRCIYFGSMRNQMWINWLVILAWIVIPGMITMIMARSEIRLRRQNMRRTHSIQV